MVNPETIKKVPVESTPLAEAPEAIRDFLATELRAIASGELRSQPQIEQLYPLLSQATPEQRALSEHLGLGLLALRNEPIRKTPCLVIRVAPDLSSLWYGELQEDLSVDDLNPTDTRGRLFANDLDIRWLVSVPNPKLITPSLNALAHSGSLEGGDRVMQMLGFNERVTFFGDIPATWSATVDRGSWSTNIDTVHFIKWLRDAGVFSGSIKRSAEIGVGIGGISQALLNDNPNIEEHVYTDISPWAINATRRNLAPYVGEDKAVWYLGKGVRALGERGTYDLIITNPPYIPHPNGDDAVDPYRGTGLIRELFEVGPSLLNPDNPNAAIYIQLSNLSLNDLERYKDEFPNIEVTNIGGPVRVPLKIWGLSREPEWYDFLKAHGLMESPELAQTTGLRYYHEISAIRLRPKR